MDTVEGVGDQLVVFPEVAARTLKQQEARKRGK